MSRWILDEYDGGELDYPTLGFRAVAGDILTATTAPDARWSLNADQGATETVDRYGPASIDNTYTEPIDGHVLAWSDAANAYQPVDMGAYIADYIAALPLFSIDPGSNLIASRLAEGGITDDITLGVAADSTLNDGTDGIRVWLDQVCDLYPDMCVQYGIWDDATKTMQTPLAELQPGTPTLPGGGPASVVDTFTRTDGGLPGDTCDTGQVWTQAGAAAWATNGTAAYAPTSPTGAYALLPTGVYGDMAVTANITFNASGAVAKSFMLISNFATTGSYLWVQVSVSSIGVVSGTMWKRVSATATQIGTFTGLGLTTNGTQTYDVSISLDETSVTGTINGVAIVGDILLDDLAVLGDKAGISSVNAGTANSITINSISVDVPVIPADVQTLTVYNAATPGKTIDYHTEWAEDMFPAELDAVLMSSGHNNGLASSASFFVLCDAFVIAIKALYPEVYVIAASQNPEFPPVGTVGAHLARQRAVGQWCLLNRHGYVPVLEAYRNEDDGGASRVQEDGIHPTTGPETTTGAYLFATTLQTHIVNALL